MTEPKAFTATCDHHYESRLLGGHPLTVRACTFCRTPDWADLAEQAAELYRWGWQEGRAGKAARETLSAYDKPVRPEHWAAQPPPCGASILGVSGPLGPCILRHRHDGLVHKDASGAQWWPKVEADEPEPAPDPLAPFRNLAHRYAAEAAEQDLNVAASTIDEVSPVQWGIAAGWRHAEFLLRHTIDSLDNHRTTPDNTVASDGSCSADAKETEPNTSPADGRLRALARNAVGPALNAHGEWLPLSVREAIADAVLAVRDQELEQLRARIVTLEHVAAGNKRHVQLIVPDLDRAEAALDRVRAECDRIEAAVRANPQDPDFDGAYLAAIRHIRAALNPPEETPS